MQRRHTHCAPADGGQQRRQCYRAVNVGHKREIGQKTIQQLQRLSGLILGRPLRDSRQDQGLVGHQVEPRCGVVSGLAQDGVIRPQRRRGDDPGDGLERPFPEPRQQHVRHLGGRIDIHDLFRAGVVSGPGGGACHQVHRTSPSYSRSMPPLCGAPSTRRLPARPAAQGAARAGRSGWRTILGLAPPAWSSRRSRRRSLE